MNQNIKKQVKTLKDKNNKNTNINNEVNKLITKLNNIYYKFRLVELIMIQNLKTITNHINSMNRKYFLEIRTKLIDILDKKQYILSKLHKVENSLNNIY